MNPNRPAAARTVAAQTALAHQHVPPCDGKQLRMLPQLQSAALARRIWELHDGGLDLFEIQSITGIPLAQAIGPAPSSP